jgi:hypothetical protein
VICNLRQQNQLRVSKVPVYYEYISEERNVEAYVKSKSFQNVRQHGGLVQSTSSFRPGSIAIESVELVTRNLFGDEA